MTEQEWLTCSDWRDLFELTKGKVSDRKLRLFAVACCRGTWALLKEDSRRAVEVAERHADEFANDDELRAVRDVFRATEANQTVEIIRGVRYRPDFGGSTADENALWAAKCAMRQSADAITWHTLRTAKPDLSFTSDEFGSLLHSEMTARRHLLYEVLGPHPFHPVIVDPLWRTATVVALAALMDESRDFSPMPILADALQDAGCDNFEMLDHCRGSGPHVRGCWLLDLILGKE